MRITSPAKNTVFTITHTPEWPALVFETNATGPHVWRWTISWRHFSKSGRASTADNRWEAGSEFDGLGGALVVRAHAGTKSAGVAVKLVGTNPTEGDVEAYLEDKTDGATMLKIVGQESRFRHFRASGEPVRSFDNGYGLCQLTDPRPSYTQAWDWRRNLDGGLALYARKKAKAIEWLSRDDRSYTDEQLEYETVSLWNGGNYHTWDAKAGAWVRRSDVMCDTATGNIGWNMKKAENAGQSEADLRERDKGGYNAHTKDSSWGYFGVCYADHLLG